MKKLLIASALSLTITMTGAEALSISYCSPQVYSQKASGNVVLDHIFYAIQPGANQTFVTCAYHYANGGKDFVFRTHENSVPYKYENKLEGLWIKDTESSTVSEYGHCDAKNTFFCPIVKKA